MNLNKTILSKLFETPGISGREEKISELLINHIKKTNLNLEIDNLGSVFGIKNSSNKKAKTLLIDAHMDEVGFMVTDILKNGFILFESIGGISNKTLNLQRLRIWNDDYSNSYTGIVEWPNTNSHKQLEKTPKTEEMLLDIGASSKEEVSKWGIKKGSVITFDTKTEYNGNRVIAKAVDNRVGLAIVMEIMNYIKDKEFDFNIIIGGSVQEEIGLIGARAFSYKSNPDISIVIDVSPAMDIPTKVESNGILGAGTMLRHKDARTIYSKFIIKYLKEIIIKNNIKYQDYFSKGGTNAGVIHLSREGIRTIPIGIVARNLHSGSTVFDLEDYKETLKLMKLILNDINSNKIVKLR
ncbi:MAG: M28 family peptidase [Mycoplasmataceae bacterium]|nr:M28 family peptidase [Mycoplasmataceae bacterium]